MGFEADKESVHAVFSHLDKDGSGSVPYGELDKRLREKYVEPPPEPEAEPEPLPPPTASSAGASSSSSAAPQPAARSRPLATSYRAPTVGSRRLGGANPYVTNSHCGPIATSTYASSLVGWPFRGEAGPEVAPEGVRRLEYDKRDMLGERWFCEITNPVPDAAYMVPKGTASAQRHTEMIERNDQAMLDRKEEEAARRRSARIRAQEAAWDATVENVEAGDKKRKKRAVILDSDSDDE